MKAIFPLINNCKTHCTMFTQSAILGIHSCTLENNHYYICLIVLLGSDESIAIGCNFYSFWNSQDFRRIHDNFVLYLCFLFYFLRSFTKIYIAISNVSWILQIPRFMFKIRNKVSNTRFIFPFILCVFKFYTEPIFQMFSSLCNI